MNSIIINLLSNLIWVLLGGLATFLWVTWRRHQKRRALNRARQNAPFILETEKPTLRKGLILLVGQLEVCDQAIAYHQESLKHCWLLYTEATRSTRLTVYGRLEEKGIAAYNHPLEDEYDFLDIRDEIDNIYLNLPDGLAETDVIVDVTGMTKPLSIGAVLACIDEQRSIQYIAPLFDDARKPVEPGDPIELKLNWETIEIAHHPETERS